MCVRICVFLLFGKINSAFLLTGLMCEILWSDPQPQPGRGPSNRAVGLCFGGDVTKRFLEDINLGRPHNKLSFTRSYIVLTCQIYLVYACWSMFLVSI